MADEKLTKVFELAEYMTTLSNSKFILNEKFKEDLIVYLNGGVFTANKETISFLSALVNTGKVETTVIIDNNGNPIDVENITEFLNKLLSTYTFAVNSYYTKYKELSSSRTVEAILNI